MHARTVLAAAICCAALAGCSGDSDPFDPPNPGPIDAETEPNGTIATANGPVAADAVVAGALATSGDYDYWAIENASGAPRTVELETFEGAIGACPNADSTLSLYDGTGALLASNDDGGLGWCSFLTYTIPPYTTCYVRVGGFGGDTFAYLLRIGFL